MTSGFASQIVLPRSSSGSYPGAPSAWKNLPACIDRTIHRQAVALADDVIFLPVARSRVDRAGSLFERDMIAQDAEGVAIEKRMPEHGVFELAPWNCASTAFVPAARFAAVRRAGPSATI